MKTPRALKTAFLGLLSLFVCQYCSAQQTSPTAPTSASTQKGTAIGQTINAAITAALPGVSAIENIIAAIFKKPAGSVPPSTTTKVSAQTVTDAVKKNVDPATLAAASQAQLTALQGAITEIATVNLLATSAQTASTALTASRALLVTSDWDDFKQQWDVAKTNLNKVTSTDLSKLGKISDENVLLAWNRVNGQYVQWISDVDNYSAKKNLTLTLASFDQLSAAIQSLARIPSVELELISIQLQTVKAQPSASANFAEPPPASTTGTLSTFLTRTLPQSE
jgi:hypothetical protein